MEAFPLVVFLATLLFLPGPTFTYFSGIDVSTTSVSTNII